MDMDELLQLRKFIAPEIVYGPGALTLAGHHACNFGASKVLVVTDPGVRQAGWAGKVEASLQAQDVAYAVFSEVTPNPKDLEVMAGAEIYRRQGCDLILAVGRGSPMDCAKGIGMVVGNDQHIRTFEGVDEVPGPGPPMIFIPTTAGTSADVSQFAVITDTRRSVKMVIVSKMAIPDIAIVDPRTTVTMSPQLTGATGMDALSHAFEAYVSTAGSILTDVPALEAVRLICSNIEGAYRFPDQMAFREPVMAASLMAGLAFSNAGLGLVHAMAHSLGGMLDLAHGENNAMLLEQVVSFNFPVAAAKYTRLAQAMGVAVEGENSETVAVELAQCLAALRQRLGFARTLSDLGVQECDLPQLVEKAGNDPCLSTNPRKASPAQIEAIYRAIY